ncbi:hypothetical protein GGP45_003099 [Salinibacter ruber]|uniref:Uncharacterized protein n=1 Tax=Salinibacter ruber TaxID=146919 RepID=A0A9X2V7J5_9BACT|nr:hypothetical protein [Salinibacter ruber]
MEEAFIIIRTADCDVINAWVPEFLDQLDGRFIFLLIQTTKALHLFNKSGEFYHYTPNFV